MIHSMTGFGRGQASSNGISVTAEAKSVNSRYLDISFHLPQEIQEKELALKELIQSKINRGNINVNIRIDKVETGQLEITINPKLVKGYKNLLEELRDVAQIEAAVSLHDLVKFDEIFVSREQDDKILKTIWQLSKKAAAESLNQLANMRAKEGKQLENDLHQRVDDIETKMEIIKSLTSNRAEESRNELLGRIQKLVGNEKLDEERLEMEVAILVDKMDITEEIVRLQSHIKFFKEALESEETVGRRLKFLSQEMNREINTIGSKANSSEISQHVVHAKESLEQIREQIQNVE
jgi:uncharacterized protein (TIGR00255 family)